MLEQEVNMSPAANDCRAHAFSFRCFLRPGSTTAPNQLSRFDCGIVTVEDRGLEHIADSSGNTHIQTPSAAKSSARGAREGARDSDLQTVISRWPDLSADQRQQVMQIVSGAPLKPTS
jgi:hypothetical protein